MSSSFLKHRTPLLGVLRVSEKLLLLNNRKRRSGSETHRLAFFWNTPWEASSFEQQSGSSFEVLLKRNAPWEANTRAVLLLGFFFLRCCYLPFWCSLSLWCSSSSETQKNPKRRTALLFFFFWNTEEPQTVCFRTALFFRNKKNHSWGSSSWVGKPAVLVFLSLKKEDASFWCSLLKHRRTPNGVFQNRSSFLKQEAPCFRNSRCFWNTPSSWGSWGSSSEQPLFISFLWKTQRQKKQNTTNVFEFLKRKKRRSTIWTRKKAQG